MTNNLDFLDEIAKYLVSLGIAVSGSTIFVNKQPATPDNCISIFGLPGTSLNDSRDVATLQFPRFQIVVRNTDYNDAADKHQAVRTALHGLVGKLLPAGVNTATTAYIRVLRCHVDAEGGPLGEDDKGRSEFAINFVAEYHHHAAG